MPKESRLPKRVQPSKALNVILNPKYIIGHGQDVLTNIGVHRIAAAMANGYSKRTICDHLKIGTVTFNIWLQHLEADEADLIQMALVDAISELRDDVMAQVIKEAGFALPKPKNRSQAEMAKLKVNLRGTKMSQLIKVHDMLDKRVLNEVKRIATQKSAKAPTTNYNQIILNSGEGGFMPPSAPAPLEG